MMKTPRKILSRSLIVGALVLGQTAAQAGPYWGHYHHHHHHGGVSVGAAVLGLAVAVPLIAMAARAERQPEVVYQPVAVPPPPPVIVQRQIEYVPAPAPQPYQPAPIIYPRNGQSAQQLEFDRQDCNRWATTQPAAMQDGSVFNRAVEACMDGRGYTMR